MVDSLRNRSWKHLQASQTLYHPFDSQAGPAQSGLCGGVSPVVDYAEWGGSPPAHTAPGMKLWGNI